MLNRRTLLSQAALLGSALIVSPRMVLAAAATERRFVFVIQRGAADGLATIIPTGDRALPPLRASLIAEGGTSLDTLFSAHPALVEISRLYGKREALFAHAVASPYRDRSHFDAQNVLETGGAAPYRLGDGWLNRLLTLLPRAESQAVALAATIPLALRGPVAVSSYAPSGLADARDDLKSRVAMLYDEDQQLHALWQSALATQALASEPADSGARRSPQAIGALAAKLLSGTGAARVAMIETQGWDTHNAQVGRLNTELKALDALIAALQTGLGESWQQTLVLVATEFGRTVAINGTGGTDHGTASAAMLLGGAVQGGRVIADWPGLAANQLYEGRDLRATLSLDSLIASALVEHYRLEPARGATVLFPQLTGALLSGLIRS